MVSRRQKYELLRHELELFRWYLKLLAWINSTKESNSEVYLRWQWWGIRQWTKLLQKIIWEDEEVHKMEGWKIGLRKPMRRSFRGKGKANTAWCCEESISKHSKDWLGFRRSRFSGGFHKNSCKRTVKEVALGPGENFRQQTVETILQEFWLRKEVRRELE